MKNKHAANTASDRTSDCDDKKSFDQIFTRYFAGLVSFSFSIVKNRQLAEDVVVDVFVKLWGHRETMKTIRSFSQYIYTATKYASINAIKKPGYGIHIENFGDDFPLTTSQSLTPEERLISKENLSVINNVINTLPPRCRLIFRLIKEDGMKYDEVAELLDLSCKTVENQMNIAFKKVFEALDAALPGLVSNCERKKA